jgi:hypothetical protein
MLRERIHRGLDLTEERWVGPAGRVSRQELRGPMENGSSESQLRAIGTPGNEHHGDVRNLADHMNLQGAAAPRLRERVTIQQG